MRTRFVLGGWGGGESTGGSEQQPQNSTSHGNSGHDHAEEESSEDEGEQASKADRERYKLVHRRFGDYNPKLLSKLHLVTNLSKRVVIPASNKRICIAYKIGKMRKRIRRTLAPRKYKLLELVSIDIAGPFPVSLRKNRYFLQIIDNYSRKIWSILLRRKFQAKDELSSWKKVVERKTGKKVKQAQSDNAPKLIQELKYWRDTDGVQVKLTTVASSHQNGPAERAIQPSTNAMRVSLADAKLPLDFWDEAVEQDAYIRNRLPTGPEIEGDISCPRVCLLWRDSEY